MTLDVFGGVVDVTRGSVGRFYRMGPILKRWFFWAFDVTRERG